MSRWLALALVTATLGPSVSAQCVTTNGFLPTNFERANVTISGSVPSHVAQGIRNGLEKWNSSSECNEGWDDFPLLDVNNEPPQIVFSYVTGLGPLTESGNTPCAQIVYSNSGPETITFYSQVKFATDPNNTYPCPSDEAGLSFIAAHEAGHYLGLANSSCTGHVMSPMGAAIGGGQATWSYPASKPTSAECAKVDEVTTTPDEEENECTEGENICSGWGNQSPLVLDLDGDGFRFSGWPDVVAFDIDDDGYQEIITWTGEGEADAFLALDRNGNGAIDSGRELFGDATRMEDGQRAPDGFTALADLDEDHNGTVDGRDPAFSQLRLWLDSNHDAVAAPRELFELEAAGIVRIDLDAVISERRDRHGNRLRFTGRFWQRNAAGREVPRQVTDVFFVGF